MISCSKFISAFTLVLAIFSTILQHTWGQVGIAYSPFVREGDNPGTSTYNINDVKVMLQLLVDMGYREITTYGVGVIPSSGTFPPYSIRPYRENETWTKSASVVLTALAAAEINKANDKLLLRVYQGLFFQNQNSNQLNVEIKVGLEVANLANRIYEGTVQGIIFPSITSFGELENLFSREEIQRVSSAAKNVGLKFGTRVTDCESFVYDHKSTLVKKLKDMDFLICQMLPNTNHMRNGPKKYFNSTIKVFQTVNTTLKTLASTSNVSSPKLILETGWPGGRNLAKQNHADVESMLQYWNESAEWSIKHAQQIFLHEAFNNPWKSSFSHILYGDQFGRWEHTEANDNLRSAYRLKVAEKQVQLSSGPSKDLIFGVVFGSVLFIVLAVLIFGLHRRTKIMKDSSGKLTAEEIRQFLDGIVTNKVVNEDNVETPWDRIPYSLELELPKDKFVIDKTTLLGSGAFGEVYKGRIEGLVNDVAFKTTRSDCPASALRGILSEIKILMYLGKHPNLVSICGAYTAELTKNGVVYLATELCHNGSLEKFLRSSISNKKATNEMRYVVDPSGLNPKQITEFQLTRWAVEIASAMEYISSKNVVHADLATRNILLTTDLTAKVTDFGLSRRLYEYTEYVKKHQEPLPWRHMSIESLRKLEFSMKSDVWSYGITLWEIFSLGDIPYPGLVWDIDFVSRLENGLRLQQPKLASEKIYEIMASCWDIEPVNRPTFKTLKDSLLTLCVKLKNA